MSQDLQGKDQPVTPAPVPAPAPAPAPAVKVAPATMVVKQTILEDGTEFDGSIKSKCPLVVSGKVKGEVTAPSLTVLETGAVQGQVKVSQLSSKGEIAGQIEADSVELCGTVSDQTTIKATTLEVKLSQPGSGKLQVTFGNTELHVGEKPAK
jgi:cytoskeletal protein CcmA (bactofilin family)